MKVPSTTKTKVQRRMTSQDGLENVRGEELHHHHCCYDGWLDLFYVAWDTGRYEGKRVSRERER